LDGQIANTFAKKQIQMEENLSKRTLWEEIKNKPYFFVLLLIYWLFGGILLTIFSKKEIHLTLNELHTTFGDLVFPWLTHLGEEWVYIVVASIFIYKKKYRELIATAIIVLLQIIIVQGIKHFVFPSQPRPKTFFEGIAKLNFVEGIDVHGYLSFPSGHTATAFSAFCWIVFFHKHPLWQFIGFIACLSVAMSRMYLQQHFFIDTFAGSIIGTLCSLLGYYYYLEKK
jgi:membrane-associated phospholipid phosphatase